MFFDVRFQYQFWDTKINNLQQTVDGVEKIYTEDDIARMSEGLRFHTTFMRVGVDIGYEVLEDLDVEVGGGLAFVNHQSNHDNPGESHELVTRKPGLYGSLASHYTVPILGKLSVTFSPDITYYSTDDLHGVGQNTDAIGLADCDFDHALIDWRARVFFGYDLDWITLYAGAMYNDYTEKMKYKGKTSPDAFGDVYAVDRTLTYAPFSHVGAVLGTGVELGGKKQLWVEVVVGRIVDLRTKIRVLF
jgi:hypothetical protein